MEITTLTAGEEGRARAVLAEAMSDDPVLTWLFPDPEDRARALPYAMGHFTALAMAAGQVLTAGGDRAASLWIVRGEGDGEPAADDPGGAGAAEALAPHVERLTALDGLLRARRPAAPHLYLSVIGVLPEARGQGLGGAMLARRLSDTALPAYLEASSPRSRALYLRHGFRPHGDPVRLPDGPDVFPMLRPAP
ncbi:GNAT family N-acetyltransferase [Nocardiopsis composta]|uniref:GNAT superfamily N-acetyltransferase n=1 Tax=Nocardiopsis composta TaxID=157465 RepID=A0A7W8QRE3_9ACTN|nr:GNAT family N-acetyltransferase [Nocardiopsis composta]MBB5434493.1 GNAT superfamily N-acetyltransferase [Nocardiopsis composta]